MTKEDASEARNRTTSATSSGCPNRPMGCILFQVSMRASGSSASSNSLSFMGVMMVPGAMQFTRILCLAYSSATCWVREIIPPLAAA